MSIEQIYERYIKVLSSSEKRRLMKMINQGWTSDAPLSEENVHAAPSILELHGLGREIWQDVDAQAYVDRLRDEWDPQ